MAVGDPYATLGELKGYLKLTGSATYDDLLTQALESASDEIERHCNRQFNKDTAPSARVYVPDTYHLVQVDDFHTTTDLVVEVDGSGDGVFEQAITDYELFPLNGVVEGQPGWPFYRIRPLNGALFYCSFPYSRKATVRVTAQWGWAAVPPPVKQACLILAAENFQLKDAPFGVVGTDTFGEVRIRENRMVAAKLARYKRHGVLVG